MGNVRVNPSDETIRLGPLAVRFLITGGDGTGSVAMFELTVPAGKSLAEIATAHGKTVDGLVGAIVAPAKARLDKAVEKGRITRQRADELLSRLTDAGYLHQAPIGIFRQVERSTYDDQARAQVTTARGGVDGDDPSRLDALLHGGDTWTVA